MSAIRKISCFWSATSNIIATRPMRITSATSDNTSPTSTGTSFVAAPVLTLWRAAIESPVPVIGTGRAIRPMTGMNENTQAHGPTTNAAVPSPFSGPGGYGAGW
ncbi:hypothetical protein FHX42_004846 [Saccharopolyspora lacisalsi]|uniref:Uncharacterized protein n=1 Tax=Halosaccharopolyspora lacisalsi TaxID=1000566 RepID=A0A839E329_9PSEU|nr:hypothetical protein [Halosaccharopolyspora lacisalsi]MBA8827450.1 hypothetical protein [Halosaccharopolyspora lacisalsi]